MTDDEFLKLAIDKAAEGIARGQTPFGAAVVKDGLVLSCEHNRVWESQDITAHAEILAIRAACARLQAVDLSGCTIYSSCEPCPMCFGASHWARISRIVYGARIADATTFGFHELLISNADLKKFGSSPIDLAGDRLRDEAIDLFRTWARRADHRPY